ncbi:MAG: cytochrome c-type biogenesis protein CcmH, partial [Anaerolineales bacterium]
MLRRKGAETPGYVFGILRHGTTAGVLRLCVLAFVLIVIPLSYVAAQTEPTDDEVNAIAKQLYCPVCENVPLDVCGTQACAQWRATIREQLSEGRTADEIKQYFAAQYGDRVLAEPPARGLNVVFWVLPPLAVFGGA